MWNLGIIGGNVSYFPILFILYIRTHDITSHLLLKRVFWLFSASNLQYVVLLRVLVYMGQ